MRRLLATVLERVAEAVRGRRERKRKASLQFEIGRGWGGSPSQFLPQRVVGFRIVGTAPGHGGGVETRSVGEGDAFDPQAFWDAWHALGGSFDEMEWLEDDGTRTPAKMEDFN